MKTQKIRPVKRKEIISFLQKLGTKFHVQPKRKLRPIAVAENDWLWHYAY